MEYRFVMRILPRTAPPRIFAGLLRATLFTLVLATAGAALAQTPPPARADADAGRRAVLRFLTDSDYPPFHYYDEERVLTGFNIDLARAICLELSAICDIQVRTWADLLPALTRGEADAVIATHSVTPATLAQFGFTDRYFYAPAWFAGRKGGTQIQATPEGLEGLRIGVARGSPHEAYLRAFFRNSAIVPFENAELAKDALAAGKIDLVFDDGISLAFWISGTLSRACCELKGGPYYEAKFFGDGAAIVVRKQDTALRLTLNRALEAVRASGRYEELLLRYFPGRLF